ncbi:phage integrase [Bartonella henselae]|nr:phage integrase [Bartonella henselae]CUH91185.1 phage integrase [Bartonella henselae]
MRLFIRFRDYLNKNTQYSSLWHTKAATAKNALTRLNLCLKHAVALSLDVDLQAKAKARALLFMTQSLKMQTSHAKQLTEDKQFSRLQRCQGDNSHSLA